MRRPSMQSRKLLEGAACGLEPACLRLLPSEPDHRRQGIDVQGPGLRLMREEVIQWAERVLDRLRLPDFLALERACFRQERQRPFQRISESLRPQTQPVPL